MQVAWDLGTERGWIYPHLEGARLVRIPQGRPGALSQVARMPKEMQRRLLAAREHPLDRRPEVWSRLLQWLTDEGRGSGRSHSRPQTGIGLLLCAMLTGGVPDPATLKGDPWMHL